MLLFPPMETTGAQERARLRTLRICQGLSQEALAAAAGIGWKTIHRLETGQCRHPRPETVRRLAEALGARAGDVAEFRRFRLADV